MQIECHPSIGGRRVLAGAAPHRAAPYAFHGKPLRV